LKQTIQRPMVVKEVTHQKKGYELRDGDSDNKECTPNFLEFKSFSVEQESKDNTEEEIDYILAELPPIVDDLRNMSPVWKDLMSGKRQFTL